MAETARDFITLAMKEAGVLGVGQTLLAEDLNDGFTLLNRMLAQWQRKRWLVPNLYEIQNLGNGNKSNLIGPGQYFNAARPDKIQAAYFKQLNGGGGLNNLVSFPLSQIWSWEDYALVQLKDLASWPQFFFYDGQYPYGNVYIWPIPDATYEIHLVLKGPIGFMTELEDGSITSGGLLYTNGTYPTVALLNLTGFGSGATADITVSGGSVTGFTLDNPGDGYKIGDQLSANSALIGGTGSGFIFTVDDVTDDLNATFNMPPEYEEAIHYNLCRRLVSMYQYPPNINQIALAKSALNTLRLANAQVPTLKMPPALRFNNNNSFYIFNADAR
jgi:hypothetical protein